MARSVHFQVDPRLAALLGEGYRTTEAALKELVDNAWDADAQRVWITLPTAPLAAGAIVVRDDGCGMTPKEVEHEYLNIASDRRSRKGQLTPIYKRKVKGRKGIGKFAGLAAADHMRIETTARARTTGVTLDKCALLQAQRDIEKVALPLDEIDAAPDAKGTTITLTSLNQNLDFPSEEALRALLIHEYGRAKDFAIIVNGAILTVEDIPGPGFNHEDDLGEGASATLRFKVADGTRAPKQPGIVLKVGGKVVGPPSFFGLEQDEDIPDRIRNRLYGEVEVDALEDFVTADWGAVIENSKLYQRVRNWVLEHVRTALYSTHKRDIDLQRARLEREINRRLEQLPEHRRAFAQAAIERVLRKFYWDREDRRKVIANVVLDALEHDEYWAVVQHIHETRDSDVAAFAHALSQFALMDLALIAQRATYRLTFLDGLDKLASDPRTLEKDIHTAIEQSLWVLGPRYAMIASNRTLTRIVANYLDKTYIGERADRRPDLLLADDFSDRYLLVEFKRPTHALGREDAAQAQKYRDDLSRYLSAKPIDIILLSGKRAVMDARYDTDNLKFHTYGDVLSRARSELNWLLKTLSST
jgi:hypothetical protein